MERLPSKAYGISLKAGDVFVLGWSRASGYGDPLERGLSLIAKDLRDGAATREWVAKIHGIIFDSAGAIDEKATTAHRERLRHARIVNVPERNRRPKLDLSAARSAAESLVLVKIGY